MELFSNCCHAAASYSMVASTVSYMITYSVRPPCMQAHNAIKEIVLWRVYCKKS